MRPITPLAIQKAVKTAALLAAATFALTTVFAESAASASPQTPTILVDGQRLASDVPAVWASDHVLVPLRGVFERFGARVRYDAEHQMAIAELRDSIVRVSLNSNDAWVNGQHRALDVGAREVAGRTMIPLRFVAQALGVSVDYQPATNTVVIVSGFQPGSFAAANTSPESMQLLAAAPKQGPSVEDERPASGDLIGSQYPQIYARFSGGTSSVNPATVRVTVDGNDVTGAATISSAYVSFTPQNALQTGEHTVTVEGSTDDGTPFSDAWTFRVDAGSSSIYDVRGGVPAFGAFSPAFGLNGNSLFFPRFGFFPPGFSLFTPGQLFFVNGDIVEVIFVSQFFPFGTAVFSVSGIPGVFPLVPWQGNPGFFWGFVPVPAGATAHHAVISARFTTPGGHIITVHSTAPLDIEGKLKRAPSSLRYAVLPRLIARPASPRHLVVFTRVMPQARPAEHSAGTLRVISRDGKTITIRSLPLSRSAGSFAHPIMIQPTNINRPEPPVHPLTPVVPLQHPVIPAVPMHPVIPTVPVAHPMIPTMPVVPARPVIPVPPAQAVAPPPIQVVHPPPAPVVKPK